MDKSSADVLIVAPTITTNEKTKATLEIRQDERPKFKHQFVAAFVCCLAPLSGGMVAGFTSPAIADMKLPGRSLSLTPDAESWLSSLIPLGGLCGGLIIGMAMDFFGRKSSIVYTAALYVFGWLFIVYAKEYAFLYLGRFLTGMCLGATCSNVPVYLGEIASPQIRGILGLGFKLFLSLGVLVAYTVGAFVPWTYLAAISAIVPTLNMIFMTLMPETPVWLVRQRRMKEAQKSIIWLRGSNYDYLTEIADIINSQRSVTTSVKFKDFLQPYFLKPFLLSEVLMFFQQFTGYPAIIFYASDIFKSAGGNMNPNVQAIILGVIMVVSNVSSSLFIDRAGRRILLLISAIVMASSSFVIGGYYYFLSIDSHSALKFSWLPMVCLFIFVSMYNFGLGPIPWLLMGELFPIQVRGAGSSLVIALNSVTMFILIKTFVSMIATIQPYGTFWLFGSFALGAAVFIWVCVPETKGKSLEEIQEIFSKKK